MGESARPAKPEELREIVAEAGAKGLGLALAGSGSKRDFGRPVMADAEVDLSGFAGIVFYEPEELVMSAGTGTRIAEIEAALRQNRQHFAFEPPDLGPLLGAAPERATLGGILACGLAGPRRIAMGGARDHFLGVKGVSGQGEIFKAGGRVMKNVTGFDLCKLLAGSHGTLAAMYEATMKVLPAPEAVRTVGIPAKDGSAGIAALTRALQSAHEVNGAAFLPQSLAKLSKIPAVAALGKSLALARLEGPEPSVRWRAETLRRELSGLGETLELGTEESLPLWREIRDVSYFVGDGRAVWRLSVPPASGAALMAKLRESSGAESYADWGGGLIWLAVPSGADAAEPAIRAALGNGGHATLIRAPEEIRAKVPVFQPQAAALAQLTRRVKESLDPLGVFNPGRMYAGV